MSSLQSNPWASGASYVSVGGLQKALKIAQSPGYQGLLLDTGRSTGRVATSSIEQIQHLKEIAKLDEKVNELQLDIQHKVALQNTADLTDPSSLDSMLKMLEELCNHLQAIMDKKQVLIGRLQEAYEDHLTVDANYHGSKTFLLKMLYEYAALVWPRPHPAMSKNAYKTTKSVGICWN
ncbi:uncharacterized protein LOC135692037 [Rhopilema esculentum]|uniref:uncharacterized protein LOC135692037 n=1 Tax=Rhopilema esculentum TaxID=499914 RepID=UPI0031E1FD44